jgi:hypothetical protein
MSSAVQALRERFLQAQATDVANRLSEQNAVEVVRRLVEGGLLSVVFTLDGKVRKNLKC